MRLKKIDDSVVAGVHRATFTRIPCNRDNETVWPSIE